MADFNRAYVVEGNDILDARVPKKGGNVGENLVTSLSFTFSDEWEGASKTIVFKSPKKVLLTPIALINDAVEIPIDALDSAGKLQFSLQGTFADSDKVIRTPIKELDVSGTLPYTGGTPIATYTDVVSLCQDATVSAESAATTANQAAERADTVAAAIAGVPAEESARVSAESARSVFYTGFNESLSEISQTIYAPTDNILDISLLVSGYLNGGVLVAGGTYKTTPYIDISSQAGVNFCNWIDASFASVARPIRFAAFYDASYVFISQDSSNAAIVTFPSNAKYARLSLSVDYLVNPMLVFGGTKPTKYIPYSADAQFSRCALFGKSAVFFGDSVCYGDFWRPSTNLVYPRNNSGWAYKLRDRNLMQVYGYGVSGATVTKKAANTNSVLEYFLSFRANGTRATAGYMPDYIILEGGINDATQTMPLGEIQESYALPPNYNTFYSALETIFYYLKTDFSTSKIGFILPHHASSYGFQAMIAPYISAIRECCEKWSIPYCDLYTKGRLNGCLENIRALYFDEWGVHPNEAGYEIMTDDIETWMLTL